MSKLTDGVRWQLDQLDQRVDPYEIEQMVEILDRVEKVVGDIRLGYWGDAEAGAVASIQRRLRDALEGSYRVGGTAWTHPDIRTRR